MDFRYWLFSVWGKGVLKKHPKDVSQEKINLQVFPNLPNFCSCAGFIVYEDFNENKVYFWPVLCYPCYSILIVKLLDMYFVFL